MHFGFWTFLKKTGLFVRRNTVFVIAALCAAVSCFIVPPDSLYADYFDLKTLVSLFCMLAVICALRNIMFFRILARKIIVLFKNTRAAITALVFVTYFASMLIANDMALLTFLPLGYIVLSSTGKEKFMMPTFILQTASANLGGMLTPFGNPQNLYIYNYFSVPTAEFFGIMWLPTLIAVAVLALCCAFIKKESFEFENEFIKKLDIKKAVVYFIMFAYAIIIVFRVVPYWTGLLFIPILLFMDRDALLKVDYVLLLTFCMFFIFSGNLARIPEVRTFFEGLLQKNVLLTGVVCCQFISNVPSAVLLSGFTDNYAPLLVAVNIGGVGSLVSSLASLITFKQFCLYQPGKAGKYLLCFHAFNFSVLALLTLICYFIF